MQIRDNVGRFARSGFVRKTIKYSLVIVGIWFVCHMFFSLYTIQHSKGIYGIVSKATFNAMIDDHAKATAWDTTPSNFVEPTATDLK